MKGFLQLCRSQLLSGISLGLALMVSALFAVYSFGDSAISARWMNLLPSLTVLYVLSGVLLMAWHRRPPRRQPRGRAHSRLPAPADFGGRGRARKRSRGKMPRRARSVWR